MDGLFFLNINKNEEIERRVLMYILSAKASDKKYDEFWCVSHILECPGSEALGYSFYRDTLLEIVDIITIIIWGWLHTNDF